MRPISRFKPGVNISVGQQLEPIRHAIEQAEKLTASPPLSVIRTPSGNHISLNPKMSFWATITGSAAPTSPEVLTPYSWTALTEGSSGVLTDFDSVAGETDDRPAYEVAGAMVPIGSVVRLFEASEGNYYLFSFSSGGMSVDGLRILAAYITVANIRYYPSDIQAWSSLPATPPDSGVFAWLAPYYQTYVWGGVPDVYLDDTRAYSGIDTGQTLTATADFGDGPEEKTLPIYWTFFSPPAMACDDDSPVIAPGTS